MRARPRRPMPWIILLISRTQDRFLRRLAAMLLVSCFGEAPLTPFGIRCLLREDPCSLSLSKMPFDGWELSPQRGGMSLPPSW